MSEETKEGSVKRTEEKRISTKETALSVVLSMAVIIFSIGMLHVCNIAGAEYADYLVLFKWISYFGIVGLLSSFSKVVL